MERSALKVFETCARIELTMAAIYELFAEQFSDDPAASALWRKTADEEQNHAQQFRLLTRMRGDVDVRSEMTPSQAGRILGELEKLREKLAKAPPALAEALRISLDLERRLADFHVDCMGVFQQESHRSMFKAMMEADRDHVQTLENAYRRLRP